MVILATLKASSTGLRPGPQGKRKRADEYSNHPNTKKHAVAPNRLTVGLGELPSSLTEVVNETDRGPDPEKECPCCWLDFNNTDRIRELYDCRCIPKVNPLHATSYNITPNCPICRTPHSRHPGEGYSVERWKKERASHHDEPRRPRDPFDYWQIHQRAWGAFNGFNGK